MNRSTYFNLHLLLDQHIRILDDSLISKLAFVLSLKEALDGRDEMEEDERFSDEVFQKQDRYNQIYLSFIKELASHDGDINEVTEPSGIIPGNLADSIFDCLSFKITEITEESNGYYPFGVTKKTFTTAVNLFYSMTVYIFRTYCWLQDIETGMQEYGVASYIIDPETELASDISPLDGIDEIPPEKLKEELLNHLIPNESDTDEMQQEKMALKQLLTYISQVGGKKHE